jgi:la-related protein 1
MPTRITGNHNMDENWWQHFIYVFIVIRYGLECLFRFYSYGLEQRFRKEIFEDFQELTLADYERGHLYGLEKFWAYTYYRKDKEKRKININEQLTKLLEKYKSVDDFRHAKAPKTEAEDTYKVPHHGVSKQTHIHNGKND